MMVSVVDRLLDICQLSASSTIPTYDIIQETLIVASRYPKEDWAVKLMHEGTYVDVRVYRYSGYAMNTLTYPYPYPYPCIYIHIYIPIPIPVYA